MWLLALWQLLLLGINWPDRNFLSLIQDSPDASVLDIATCQAFPLLAGLFGVPVCSIICRYNLLQSGILRRKVTANIVAVAFPWIITIPLQSEPGMLQVVLDWGSLLFGSVCNFIIPAIIYTAYQKRTTVTTTNSLTLGLLHDEFLQSLNASEHWALPGRQVQQSYWKYQFGFALTIIMSVVVCVAIVQSETGQ